MSSKLVAAIVGFGLLAAASADAGTISGGGGSAGAGLGVVDFALFAAGASNNDDYDGPLAGNPNVIGIEKRFDANGLITITFEISDTGGVTEFAISEAIVNNTGLPWVGYQFALGYLDDGDVVVSTAGDGLALDPTGFSVSAFIGGSATEDVLTLDTGSVANGDVLALNLSIDIPDGITSLVLLQLPIPGEIPAIPAPGAAVFLPVAAWLAMRGAHRSRRRAPA